MTAPTLVQNHAQVEDIRTLYVRFKQPVTVGNIVIVMPTKPKLTIKWVTDTAHNSWVRENVFWWATITGWTPDLTVGVEGDGDVDATEFSGIVAIDSAASRPSGPPKP